MAARTRGVMMLLTVVTQVAIAVAPVGASEGGSPPAVASVQQGPSDAAELEAFLDDLLTRQMAQRHIAGAAVAVVRDGRLFFAKGYGLADLERQVPVDAGRTVFRIGSVTKLFTWTAVMQLQEQGRLDLDADLDTYLDFHIPDTFPQPITLRHLMTHTPGFEDRHVDMVTLDEAAIAPERAWLSTHIPARVFPPGEVPAYSNYGAALAGYVVARVSGESYSRYVQDHILRPLGMRSSCAAWPAPADLRTRESVGYMDRDGAMQVFPRLYGHVDLFPAGVIEATVTDMARFMIAHLQDGLYGDDATPETRILLAATARQMRSTLYAPAPGMLGTLYGFFDFSDNGQTVIGHGGEAEPMESTLFLLPARNVGVFVVYNSLGGGGLTNQHRGFQRAFLDHYYPSPAPEPIRPPAGFAGRADHFRGAYTMTRNAYTTFEKFVTLMNPALEVTNPGDGTLAIATPWGRMSVVEESPLYFRQVDGRFHFAFREDAQGRVAYMFTDLTPQFAFQKAAWYGAPGFNTALLLACLLLFVSVLPVAAVRALRLARRVEGRAVPRGAWIVEALVLSISLLNLSFVTGTYVFGEQIVFGIPTGFKVVLGLGVLSAALTVGAAAGCPVAWRNHYWSAAYRAHLTLVTVAAIAFVWFLHFWNLLGWRY